MFNLLKHAWLSGANGVGGILAMEDTMVMSTAGEVGSSSLDVVAYVREKLAKNDEASTVLTPADKALLRFIEGHVLVTQLSAQRFSVNASAPESTSEDTRAALTTIRESMLQATVKPPVHRRFGGAEPLRGLHPPDQIDAFVRNENAAFESAPQDPTSSAEKEADLATAEWVHWWQGPTGLDRIPPACAQPVGLELSRGFELRATGKSASESPIRMFGPAVAGSSELQAHLQRRAAFELASTGVDADGGRGTATKLKAAVKAKAKAKAAGSEEEIQNEYQFRFLRPKLTHTSLVNRASDAGDGSLHTEVMDNLLVPVREGGDDAQDRASTIRGFLTCLRSLFFARRQWESAKAQSARELEEAQKALDNWTKTTGNQNANARSHDDGQVVKKSKRKNAESDAKFHNNERAKEEARLLNAKSSASELDRLTKTLDGADDRTPDPASPSPSGGSTPSSIQGIRLPLRSAALRGMSSARVERLIAVAQTSDWAAWGPVMKGPGAKSSARRAAAVFQAKMDELASRHLLDLLDRQLFAAVLHSEHDDAKHSLLRLDSAEGESDGENRNSSVDDSTILSRHWAEVWRALVMLVSGADPSSQVVSDNLDRLLSLPFPPEKPLPPEPTGEGNKPKSKAKTKPKPKSKPTAKSTKAAPKVKLVPVARQAVEATRKFGSDILDPLEAADPPQPNASSPDSKPKPNANAEEKSEPFSEFRARFITNFWTPLENWLREMWQEDGDHGHDRQAHAAVANYRRETHAHPRLFLQTEDQNPYFRVAAATAGAGYSEGEFSAIFVGEAAPAVYARVVQASQDAFGAREPAIEASGPLRAAMLRMPLNVERTLFRRVAVLNKPQSRPAGSDHLLSMHTQNAAATTASSSAETNSKKSKCKRVIRDARQTTRNAFSEARAYLRFMRGKLLRELLDFNRLPEERVDASRDALAEETFASRIAPTATGTAARPGAAVEPPSSLNPKATNSAAPKFLLSAIRFAQNQKRFLRLRHLLQLVASDASGGIDVDWWRERTGLFDLHIGHVEQLRVLSVAYLTALVVAQTAEKAELQLQKAYEAWADREAVVAGKAAAASSMILARTEEKLLVANADFFETAESCLQYDPLLYPELILFSATKKQNLWPTQIEQLSLIANRRDQGVVEEPAIAAAASLLPYVAAQKAAEEEGAADTAAVSTYDHLLEAAPLLTQPERQLLPPGVEQAANDLRPGQAVRLNQAAIEAWSKMYGASNGRNGAGSTALSGVSLVRKADSWDSEVVDVDALLTGRTDDEFRVLKVGADRRWVQVVHQSRTRRELSRQAAGGGALASAQPEVEDYLPNDPDEEAQTRIRASLEQGLCGAVQDHRQAVQRFFVHYDETKLSPEQIELRYTTGRDPAERESYRQRNALPDLKPLPREILLEAVLGEGKNAAASGKGRKEWLRAMLVGRARDKDATDARREATDTKYLKMLEDGDSIAKDECGSRGPSAHDDESAPMRRYRDELYQFVHDFGLGPSLCHAEKRRAEMAGLVVSTSSSFQSSRQEMGMSTTTHQMGTHASLVDPHSSLCFGLENNVELKFEGAASGRIGRGPNYTRMSHVLQNLLSNTNREAGAAASRKAAWEGAKNARKHYKKWIKLTKLHLLGEAARQPGATSTPPKHVDRPGTPEFAAFYRRQRPTDNYYAAPRSGTGAESFHETTKERFDDVFSEFVNAFESCESDLQRIRLLDSMTDRAPGPGGRPQTTSDLLRSYSPRLQRLRHCRARFLQSSRPETTSTTNSMDKKGHATEIPNPTLLAPQEAALKEVAALYVTQLYEDCKKETLGENSTPTRILPQSLHQAATTRGSVALLLASSGINVVSNDGEAARSGGTLHDRSSSTSTTFASRATRVAMGQGKTSVMTPLLLKIIANAHKLPIVVFADPLYSTASRDLQESLSAFDMRVLPLRFTLASTNTLPKLLTLRKQLEDAAESGNAAFATKAKVLQGIYAAGEKAWEDLREMESRDLLLSFSVPQAQGAGTGITRRSDLEAQESAGASWIRYTDTVQCLHQLRLRYRKISADEFVEATVDPEDANLRNESERQRGLHLEELFEELSTATNAEGRDATVFIPESGKSVPKLMQLGSPYPCDKFYVEQMDEQHEGDEGQRQTASAANADLDPATQQRQQQEHIKYKIPAADADRMLETAWRAALLEKKAEVYNQLRTLIERKAAVLCDEGDNILHSRKQLNYPLGEPLSISADGIEIATFILHEVLVNLAQPSSSVGTSPPPESEEEEVDSKKLLLDEVIANSQTKIDRTYLLKQVLLPLPDILCEEIRRAFRDSPGALRSDILNESTDQNFKIGCSKYLRHAIENEQSKGAAASGNAGDDASIDGADAEVEAAGSPPGSDQDQEQGPPPGEDPSEDQDAGETSIPEQTTGAVAARPEYEIMKDSAAGFYRALSTVNVHDIRWKRLQDQLSVAKTYIHPMILDAFEKEVGKEFGWSIEDQELEASVPYKAVNQPAEMKGEVSLIKDPWECVVKTVMTKLATPFWLEVFSNARGPNTYGRAFRQAKRLLVLLMRQVLDVSVAPTVTSSTRRINSATPDATSATAATSIKTFRLKLKPDNEAFPTAPHTMLNFSYKYGSRALQKFFFAKILKEELGLGNESREDGEDGGTSAATTSPEGKLLAAQIAHHMRQEMEEEDGGDGDEDTTTTIAGGDETQQHDASGIPPSLVAKFARFIRSLQVHQKTSRRICFLQLMLWYQMQLVFPNTKHIKRYTGQVTSGPMELVFAGSESFAWSGTNNGRLTWQARLQPPLTKTEDVAFVHESDTDPAENTRQQLLNDPKTAIIIAPAKALADGSRGFENPIDHLYGGDGAADDFYSLLRKQSGASSVRVSAFIDVGAHFKGEDKRLVACGMLYYVHFEENARQYISFWEDADDEITTILMYNYAELFASAKWGSAVATVRSDAATATPQHPSAVAAHCQERVRVTSPTRLVNGKHESFLRASKEQNLDDLMVGPGGKCLSGTHLPSGPVIDLKPKLFTWFDQPRTFGSDVPRDDGSIAFATVSETTGKDQLAQGVARMRGFPFGKQHIAFVVEERTMARMKQFRRDWFYPVHKFDCVRFSFSIKIEQGAGRGGGEATELRESVLGLVMEGAPVVVPSQGTAALNGEEASRGAGTKYQVYILTAEFDRLRAMKDGEWAAQLERYSRNTKVETVKMDATCAACRIGAGAHGDGGAGHHGGPRMTRPAGANPLGGGGDPLTTLVSVTKISGMTEVYDRKPDTLSDFELQGQHYFDGGEANLSMTERLSNEEPLKGRAHEFYSSAAVPSLEGPLTKQDVVAHAWWTQERSEKKAYADALVMQVRSIVKRPLQFWRSFLSGYKMFAKSETAFLGSVGKHEPQTRFRENDCAEVAVEEIPGTPGGETDAESERSGRGPQRGTSAGSAAVAPKVFIRGYNEALGLYQVETSSKRMSTAPDPDEKGPEAWIKYNPAGDAAHMRMWQVRPQALRLQKRYVQPMGSTVKTRTRTAGELRCTPHHGFSAEEPRSRFANGDLVRLEGIAVASEGKKYNGEVARVVRHDDDRQFYVVEVVGAESAVAVAEGINNVGRLLQRNVTYENMRLYIHEEDENTSAQFAFWSSTVSIDAATDADGQLLSSGVEEEHEQQNREAAAAASFSSHRPKTPNASSSGNPKLAPTPSPSAFPTARALSHKIAHDVLVRDRDLDFVAQTFHAAARDLLLTVEDGSLWKQMGTVQELSDPVVMVDVFAARMMREVRWRFTHILSPELLDALEAALKVVVTRASIYAGTKFRGLPERMMAASSMSKNAASGGDPDPDGGASSNGAEVQLQLEVQLEQEALRESNVERFSISDQAPSEMTQDSGWGLPPLLPRETDFLKVVPRTSTLFKNEKEDVFVPWFTGHVRVEMQNLERKAEAMKPFLDLLREVSTSEKCHALLGAWAPSVSDDQAKPSITTKEEAARLSFVEATSRWRRWSRRCHPDKIPRDLDAGSAEGLRELSKEFGGLWNDYKRVQQEIERDETKSRTTPVGVRISKYLQSATLMQTPRRLQELLHAFSHRQRVNKWQQSRDAVNARIGDREQRNRHDLAGPAAAGAAEAGSCWTCSAHAHLSSSATAIHGADGLELVFRQPIWFSADAARPWKAPEYFLGAYETPLNKVLLVRENVVKPILFELSLEIDAQLDYPVVVNENKKQGSGAGAGPVELKELEAEVQEFYDTFRNTVLLSDEFLLGEGVPAGSAASAGGASDDWDGHGSALRYALESSFHRHILCALNTPACQRANPALAEERRRRPAGDAGNGRATAAARPRRGPLIGDALAIRLADVKWQKSKEREDYETFEVDTKVTANHKDDEYKLLRAKFREENEILRRGRPFGNAVWPLMGADGGASPAEKVPATKPGPNSFLPGRTSTTPAGAATQANTNARRKTSSAGGEKAGAGSLTTRVRKHEYKQLWLQFEVSISDEEMALLHDTSDGEAELLFRFAAKLRELLGFDDTGKESRITNPPKGVEQCEKETEAGPRDRAGVKPSCLAGLGRDDAPLAWRLPQASYDAFSGSVLEIFRDKVKWKPAAMSNLVASFPHYWNLANAQERVKYVPRLVGVAGNADFLRVHSLLPTLLGLVPATASEPERKLGNGLDVLVENETPLALLAQLLYDVNVNELPEVAAAENGHPEREWLTRDRNLFKSPWWSDSAHDSRTLPRRAEVTWEDLDDHMVVQLVSQRLRARAVLFAEAVIVQRSAGGLHKVARKNVRTFTPDGHSALQQLLVAGEYPLVAETVEAEARGAAAGDGSAAGPGGAGTVPAAGAQEAAEADTGTTGSPAAAVDASDKAERTGGTWFGRGFIVGKTKIEGNRNGSGSRWLKSYGKPY
eukprot:g1429.t1